MGTINAPPSAHHRVWGAHYINNRQEHRTLCQGEVLLFPDVGSQTGIEGQLIDVSSSGFRASYSNMCLPSGTEVRFRHKFFQGRARVVWSSFVLNAAQSGFLVLRD